MTSGNANVLDLALERSVYRDAGIDRLTRLTVRPDDWYFDFFNAYRPQAIEHFEISRYYRPEGFDLDHAENVFELGLGHYSRFARDTTELAALGIALIGHDFVKGGLKDPDKSAEFVGRMLEGERIRYKGRLRKEVNYAIDTGIKLILAHEDYKSMRVFEGYLDKKIPKLAPEILKKDAGNGLKARILEIIEKLGLGKDRTFDKMSESFCIADQIDRTNRYRIILVTYGYLNKPLLYLIPGAINFKDIGTLGEDKYFLVRPEELTEFDPPIKLKLLDSLVNKAKDQYIRAVNEGKLEDLLENAREIKNMEIARRRDLKKEEERRIYPTKEPELEQSVISA